jgi:hypothetical protein
MEDYYENRCIPTKDEKLSAELAAINLKKALKEIAARGDIL